MSTYADCQDNVLDMLVVSTTHEGHDHDEVGVVLFDEGDWPWGWFHYSVSGFGPAFVSPVCYCCGFKLTAQGGDRWVFGSDNCSFYDDALVTKENARALLVFCRAHKVKLTTNGFRPADLLKSGGRR